MDKNAYFDGVSPAMLFVTQLYLPSSSSFTPPSDSWFCMMFCHLVKIGMTLALGFEFAAFKLLFLTHVIFGFGRPAAEQLKVTLEPKKNSFVGASYA